MNATTEIIDQVEGLQDLSLAEGKPWEKIVDTAQMQFQELLRFASILGFEFNGTSFERESKNKLLRAITSLSFNRFVKLYQINESCVVPEVAYAGKYGFVFFDAYAEGALNMIPFYASDLKAALESRELEKVKIQLTKQGLLKVLSHKVEFTNSDAGEEFSHLVASQDL